MNSTEVLVGEHVLTFRRYDRNKEGWLFDARHQKKGQEGRVAQHDYVHKPYVAEPAKGRRGGEGRHMKLDTTQLSLLGMTQSG